MLPIDTEDPQYQVGYSYALSIWGLAFLLAIYHQTRRLALYMRRRKWLQMVAPEMFGKDADDDTEGQPGPLGNDDTVLLSPPNAAFMHQNPNIPRLSVVEKPYNVDSQGNVHAARFPFGRSTTFSQRTPLSELFPDSIVNFAVATSRLSSAHSPPRVWLYKFLNLQLNIPWFSPNLTLKQVFSLLIYLGVNLLFLFWGPFTTPYPQIPQPSTVADRCAYLGIANFSFVLAFSTRNSIFSKMIGIPFENMITYHRWFARVAFILVAYHACWHITQNFYVLQVVGQAMFGTYQFGWGSCSLIALSCIVVTSHEVVRRRWFEVFYFVHLIGMSSFVITSTLHVDAFLPFIAPGAFLWVVDRAIRFFTSKFLPTKIVAIEPVGDSVTRIVFRKKEMARWYIPGQYVFVSFGAGIPGKLGAFTGWAQWHPFTIAEYNYNGQSKRFSATDADPSGSRLGARTGGLLKRSKSTRSVRDPEAEEKVTGPGDLTAAINIKASGPYTERLYKIATSKATMGLPRHIPFAVDGPYGAPTVDFQDHHVAVLVSTGIGVTPMIAILRDLIERRAGKIRTMRTESVYFIWAVPEEKDYQMFADPLHHFTTISQKTHRTSQPVILHLRIHITRSETPAITTGYQSIIPGRPDINEIFGKIKQEHPEEDVGVAVCGQKDFMREVTNIAIQKCSDEKGIWWVHSEKFDL